MPRYYFHLWCGGQLAADETGCALPGLEAARRQAETVASSVIAQSPCMPGDGSGWDVEVTDEAGRTVLLLPVGDAGRTAIRKRAA